MPKKELSNPSSFCTVHELIKRLTLLATQHPDLYNKPVVFVDKTKSKHRFLGFHHCSDAGFTASGPDQFGMCPALVIEELV